MSLKELEIKSEYRASMDYMASDFYIPVLKEAVSYDRAVGFFSSTVLSQIAIGIIPFANKGGYIRLIASPVLSHDDMEAIKLGYEKRADILTKALEVQLFDTKDVYEEKRLNLLANLIADKKMDIRIALVENEKGLGIYHEKLGLFKDREENEIAFSGSMNETDTGMTANYEIVDVFRSWKGEGEKERIEKKKNAFENIWNGSEPKLITVEVPDLKESIINKYQREKIDYKKLQAEDYYELKGLVNKEKNDKTGVPRIPKNIKLHKYQQKAIVNWRDNGYCGIFDMATGTGKTFTGLGAISYLAEELNDELAVIIVCPYQHLVEQWVEDIERFGMKPIVGYGASKQKDWKRDLDNAIRDYKLKVKNRTFFCFITTNASFALDYVQKILNRLRGNILLVVDEAHNFGAKSLKKLLDEKYNYRIALSATINRYGDEEGTEALFNYFGEKCIEYTLEMAIKEHKLTPYKYYPVIVYLSEREREEYDDLSFQISRCVINDKKGKKKLSEKGKKLAIKRARLVAGAGEKINVLEEKIQPYINDKHILVYCGAAKVLQDNEDYTEVDSEDIRQIDIVTDLLGNKYDMKVSQFTSKEDIDERNVLKEEFAKGDNLQALIAIKCLDEGVNIPSIKTAFILASTTNPKEYIQRRGRVLRISKGKEFAEIYDFITLPRPIDEVSGRTFEQMSRELTLVKNELCRAEEFARLAENSMIAYALIDDIKENYGLNDKILQFEEDEYYGE
ncbi:DEAD/DEAH box helicase family protein [Butyribacter intestini]|jgi:superfamily II DNA or RNA helicase|uniref:DEAD/DEAH box helicase family protein n=1 Tax=Butyribacter intestini TaxID=1703332 RepID=UPI000961F054|nr:DEAD/DEAH box helicase family protein [Butyribacter intestini]OKZ81477.1 MAG: DNA repair protein [Clostridium sp. CAG:12237_41]